MNRRVVISIANFAAIVLAFIVLIDFPQYQNEAFYFLIAWMVAGFVLLYAIRPRDSPLPNADSDLANPFPSSGSAAPLPSSPSAGGIGFCIYCAAPIAPGTRACPACGHALPHW